MFHVDLHRTLWAFAAGKCAVGTDTDETHSSARYHFWSRPIFVILLFVLVLFGRRFGRVVFGFVVWFALGVIEEKSIVWFVLTSSVFCVQRLKRLKASFSAKTVYFG
jgi:hypothetical protein